MPNTTSAAFSGAASSRAEDSYREAFDAARAQWPQIDLSFAAFAQLLGESQPEPVHVGDFYLACACVLEVPAATAALSELVRAEVRRSFGSMPSFCDEVSQQILERLLVGTTDRPAQIATYSGAGSLAAWLRSSVMRIGVRAQQQDVWRTRREVDFAQTRSADVPRPDLALIKESVRKPFNDALRVALGSLSPRERALLGFHFANGLTLEEIGTLYQVHRSTVARWIAMARASVIHRLREQLCASLQTTEGEVDSLINAMASQLHVTVDRLILSQ